MVKKTGKKKAKRKVTKKKVAKKRLVTQNRLNEISEDLEYASHGLRAALSKADKLNLGEREDTRRAYQQIKNAGIRCDAAIDELAV